MSSSLAKKAKERQENERLRKERIRETMEKSTSMTLVPKGTIREHLIRKRIINPKDKMNAERREAKDYASNDGFMKKLREMTAQFFNKVDENRLLIKQTNKRWKFSHNDTALELEGKTLGGTDWQVLEDILEINPKYKYNKVAIKNCSIGDNDAIVVFAMLEASEKAETVDLSFNLMTDKCAKELKEMLLFNTKIKSLDIRANKFSVAAAEPIYEAIRIKSDRKWEETKTDAYKKKYKLSLTSPHAYVNCLEEFNGLPIQKLLYDEDIKILDMQKKNFREFDAAIICNILCEMKSGLILQEINLSSNMINFRGIDEILIGCSQLSSLRKLDLSNNPIGIWGGEYVAEYIEWPTCKLTHFNLEKTSITKSMQTINMRAPLKILKALTRGNRSIIELNLEGNDIYAKLMTNIEDSLKVNRSLLYNSSKKSREKFQEVVIDKLPKVPTFQPWNYDRVEAIVYDEAMLRRESHKFKTFLIEPPDESKNVERSRPKSAPMKGGLSGLLGKGMPMMG